MNQNEGNYSSFQTNNTINKITNNNYITCLPNNDSNSNNKFIKQNKKSNKKHVTINDNIIIIDVKSYKEYNKLYCYDGGNVFENFFIEQNEYANNQTNPLFNKNLRDSLKKEENKSKCCCIIF